MIAKGLLVAHAVLDNNKSCPCLVDSRLDLLWNRVLVDCLVRAYDVVKSLACLCYTPDDYSVDFVSAFEVFLVHPHGEREGDYLYP